MSALTANDITVKDRIMLHLNRFPEVTQAMEYNVPFDLTQDGIASVVGITRAHASIEMKKLTDAGLAVCWSAHMKGSKCRRRVYCLEKAGQERAAELTAHVNEAGMQVEVLLDMKRCDAGTKWESLSPEDRETFGRACVLRTPVPRNILPATPTGVLPADFYGIIQIPQDVARSYIQRADAESQRRWHSWAADWWLTEQDWQERLYHLVQAGRCTEACRLTASRTDSFLANPNKDLLAILDSFSAPAVFIRSTLWLKAETALACNELREASRYIGSLAALQDPTAPGLDARLSLAEGKSEKAYETAAAAFAATGEPGAAVTAVRALLALNRCSEAEQLLSIACASLKERREARGLSCLLTVRAGLAYVAGDRDNTMILLSKAAAAAPEYARAQTAALTEGVLAGRPHLKFW